MLAPVSICIPLFRPNEAYLSELLRSLAAQTVLPAEVVLSDDDSDLDLETLARSLRRTSVRYARNPKPLGMAANWNAAVRMATSTYVAVIAQDDILYPTFIDEYMATFDQHPDLHMCSSNRTVIDDVGRQMNTTRWRITDRNQIFASQRFYVIDGRLLHRLCLRNGSVYGELSTLMFKRSSYDSVNGFDVTLEHAADFDLYMRISHLGKAGYINRPLVAWRNHHDNLTNVNIRNGIRHRERLILFRRHVGCYDEKQSTMEGYLADLFVKCVFDAGRAAVGRNWRLAMASLQDGFRNYPGHIQPILGRVREIVSGHNADSL